MSQANEVPRRSRKAPEGDVAALPAAESGILYDWERLIVIAATILVLFFYTRACPFPAGTFWDLASARDFDLSPGWVMAPETLALWVAQSSASMLGLKALYHLVFFFLTCIVGAWVFRSREILPGLLILALFTFGMQSALSLRWILQLLFMAGTIAMFEGDFLKGSFGWVLIPVTAAAAGLGLNSWLLVGLVAAYSFVRWEFRLSLVLCALFGLLFFPEGAAGAFSNVFPLAARFPNPEELTTLTWMGVLFLIPTLLALPLIEEEDLPLLVFYAAIGIYSLLSPAYLPAFILTGVISLLKVLGDIEPLSLNVRLLGLILIGVLVHVLLFLGPTGFRLNPAVQGEAGPALEPLVSSLVERQTVPAHELGELMWKGLVNPSLKELETIRPTTIVPLMLVGNIYQIDLQALNASSTESPLADALSLDIEAK